MANSLWVTVCSWLYLWQSDSLPLWQQQVSMAACSLCQAISSDPTLDQQGVSDTASLLSCNSVIILHATSHWSPTACEITSYFFLPNNIISCHPSYDKQRVSSTAASSHLSPDVTKSKWVTFPSLFCQAVSSYCYHMKASVWHCNLLVPSHLILQSTASEWCNLFCFHHLISSHDHQRVSDFTLFSAWQSHHLTVTLPWLTDCQWLYPCFARQQSHHICVITNRKWATLPFFSAWQTHDISCHWKQFVE